MSFEALVRNVLYLLQGRRPEVVTPLSLSEPERLLRTGLGALAVEPRCVDDLLAVPFIGTDVCSELNLVAHCLFRHLLPQLSCTQ